MVAVSVVVWWLCRWWCGDCRVVFRCVECRGAALLAINFIGALVCVCERGLGTVVVSMCYVV